MEPPQKVLLSSMKPKTSPIKHYTNLKWQNNWLHILHLHCEWNTRGVKFRKLTIFISIIQCTPYTFRSFTVYITCLVLYPFQSHGMCEMLSFGMPLFDWGYCQNPGWYSLWSLWRDSFFIKRKFPSHAHSASN